MKLSLTRRKQEGIARKDDEKGEREEHTDGGKEVAPAVDTRGKVKQKTMRGAVKAESKEMK